MFRIHALPVEIFAPLFPLDDANLKHKGARRLVAHRSPGFPCRVSLEDAEPGETLLLVQHTHHDVDSPYRASGPVFVRETAAECTPAIDEIPPMLQRRLLSVRGYGAQGRDLHGAEVVEGTGLATTIAAMFEDDDIDYMHIHIARPGCYAARVTRA